MFFAYIISVILGYFFGNILTAEIVARIATGKSIFTIGTGNPGMANTMAQIGFKEGAIVLAGDLAKTVIPCMLVRFVLFPANGLGASAFAGLGVILGHNYPIWHKFKGGKGVSATCAAIFCINPPAGLLSMIAGMYVTFFTKYLPVGAVIIPAAFTVFSVLFRKYTVAVISTVMTLLMFLAHRQGLIGAFKKSEKRVDVIKNANNKFGKYTSSVFLIISFISVAGLLFLLVR